MEDKKEQQGGTSNAEGGSNSVLGNGNTINETSVILRFLSVIEEQQRTITRLQERIIELTTK